METKYDSRISFKEIEADENGPPLTVCVFIDGKEVGRLRYVDEGSFMHRYEPGNDAMRGWLREHFRHKCYNGRHRTKIWYKLIRDALMGPCPEVRTKPPRTSA